MSVRSGRPAPGRSTVPPMRPRPALAAPTAAPLTHGRRARRRDGTEGVTVTGRSKGRPNLFPAGDDGRTGLRSARTPPDIAEG